MTSFSAARLSRNLPKTPMCKLRIGVFKR
jgi:hypothetical protein